MFWNGNTASDGLSGKRQSGVSPHRALMPSASAVDVHRPGDVLDLLLAQILEREIELVAHLVMHDPADTDAARLGQGFEPCGDIDAVAVDVARPR